MPTYTDIAVANVESLTVDNFENVAFTDQLVYEVPADVKYARVFVRSWKWLNSINPNIGYTMEIVPVDPRSGAPFAAPNRVNLLSVSQVGAGSGAVIKEFQPGVTDVDESQMIFPGEKIYETLSQALNTGEYVSAELYILEFK